MNHTNLALVAALAAIGLYTFVATQSAAADFDTSNSASQSASNTATATGGNGGDASINQNICQQAGQSGAFGSSSNNLKEC
jgi:hypothetical protein